MEQENIQNQIVEVKTNKWAKCALKILLVISFISMLIFSYKLFYLDAFWHNYGYGFMKLRVGAFIILLILIICYVLNFLPYFIAKNLYKKEKYVKQIIWGVLTLVIFQFLIYWAGLAFVCGWCTDRDDIKKYNEVVVPLLPNNWPN